MKIFLLLALATPLAAATFDVRAHGATGDGKTLDTAAIQRAVDAASAAGGGTVEFPSGNYLSFSVQLRSHIAVHLGPGATLVAAEPPADLSTGYDAPEPNPVNDQYQDFGHSHFRNSLLWGENLEHVAITGPGRIYGKGLSREHDRRDLLPEERDLPAHLKPDVSLPRAFVEELKKRPRGRFDYPNLGLLPAGVGNKPLALKNCRNVILRDFTVYHGGNYAMLLTGCDNVTIDNLTIDTNRDGIDLDGCRNVRVANCAINSPEDDALVLKSSYALGEVRFTENVTITNCQLSGYDEGTLLSGTRTRLRPMRRAGAIGRIKLGTESNGGFRNIAITNCTFDYCRGLAIESVDGALLEDIVVSNLTMRDIHSAPIFIWLGARMRGPDGLAVGTARRIRISHIVAHNVSADGGILISGLADRPIEDLYLSDIFMDFAGGGTAEQAARELPEHRRSYPEPGFFITKPSWGLFVRNVKNISLHNIELRVAQPDLRPVAILDSVTGATLARVTLPAAAGAARIVLKNSRDITLTACPDLKDLQRAGPFALERIE